MTRVLMILLALALGACGGGGESASTAPPVVLVPPPTLTLSGVAATGGPIAGRISLKDAAGTEQSVDTADGRFTFVVTDLSPPFMLKAGWTSAGLTQTLYSFSAATVGGIANITPLTQMAVASAARTTALDAVYDTGSAAAFAAIAVALPTAIAQVESSLAPLLAEHGAAAIDPVSGAFAADHTGMDGLLDAIARDVRA